MHVFSSVTVSWLVIAAELLAFLPYISLLAYLFIYLSIYLSCRNGSMFSLKIKN